MPGSPSQRLWKFPTALTPWQDTGSSLSTIPSSGAKGTLSSREGTRHAPGVDAAAGTLAAPTVLSRCTESCCPWARPVEGRGGGVPHKGGAAPDADECAHGSQVGAQQRAKHQHPVLGALAPKDPRPPFLSTPPSRISSAACMTRRRVRQALPPKP